jgi:undecaprenyl-diphosphatase
MSILQALILGIVQGLTEFLPVSSSGHLVLVQQLFGVDGTMVVTFDVALHFGTLIAVMVIYWQRIIEMIKRPFAMLPMYLVLGTVPTVIIALLLKDAIENTYSSAALLGPGFIFTGAVLIIAEKMGSGRKGLTEMKPMDSILIGVGQGVALLPSISRSGMTITTGLALGLERGFAADFAFLLSIPAILGGTLLDVVKVVKGETAAISAIGTVPLIVGVVAAAVTGFLSIKLMLTAIKKAKLKYFAYYVVVLGTLIIIGQVFFKDFMTGIGL